MLNHTAGCGFFDDAPIPFLSFELIGNLHGGASRCSGFRAKADVGGSLIILNRDISEVGGEGLHVERTERREMLTHCGANSFIVGRLLFAARDETKSQGTRRDGDFVKELFHLDLRQNCSAIFARPRTLISAAFRGSGGQKERYYSAASGSTLNPILSIIGGISGLDMNSFQIRPVR